MEAHIPLQDHGAPTSTPTAFHSQHQKSVVALPPSDAPSSKKRKTSPLFGHTVAAVLQDAAAEPLPRQPTPRAEQPPIVIKREEGSKIAGNTIAPTSTSTATALPPPSRHLDDIIKQQKLITANVPGLRRAAPSRVLHHPPVRQQQQQHLNNHNPGEEMTPHLQHDSNNDQQPPKRLKFTPTAGRMSIELNHQAVPYQPQYHQQQQQQHSNNIFAHQNHQSYYYPPPPVPPPQQQPPLPPKQQQQQLQYTWGRNEMQHHYPSSPSPPQPPAPSVLPSNFDYDLGCYLPPEMCDIYCSQKTSKKGEGEGGKRGGGGFTLYPWQVECLARPGVLEGSKNLVYCAPTSGGKSIVAEILMLRRLLETDRPAILVLPFKSLCTEKANHLAALLTPFHKVVKEFWGGTLNMHAPLDCPNTGVVVCTIERANMLVNKLLEEGRIDALSSVVVDELHMLGDEERGYQLELLLTKLRYISGAGSSGNSVDTNRMSNHQRINGLDALLTPYQSGNGSQDEQQHYNNKQSVQIIGMSATLPNSDQVANWLGAELYITDTRPIQLQEMILVKHADGHYNLEDKMGIVVRQVELPVDWPLGSDSDLSAWLTYEVVKQGCSVLMFCGTKNSCQTEAKRLARLMNAPERSMHNSNSGGGGQSGNESQQMMMPLDRATLIQELERLLGGGGGLTDPELPSMVSKGIAYHHAGLTAEERELIEQGYKSGALSVLCATSTLAAGVNLPARRVVFKHAWVGRSNNMVDSTKYRQMAGRAGRAGLDTAGESILLATGSNTNPSTTAKLKELIKSDLPPVQSCLVEGKKGMNRAMLEVVAAGIVKNASDVSRYVKCTLFATTTTDFDTVIKATQQALIWLGHKDRPIIKWNDKTKEYAPTQLGKAALGSGLPPENAVDILTDLSKARQGFVMSTELHLTYLCVPINEELEPNWNSFYRIASSLSDTDKKVAANVGLDMGYLQQCSKIGGPHRSASQSQVVVGVVQNNGNNPTITCGSSLPTTQYNAANTNNNANNPHPPPPSSAAAATGAFEDKVRVCRRFWGALILRDLIEERPTNDIETLYAVSRGAIQGLQDRAERFASMVAAFCERLEWPDLQILIEKFQARVLHGVKYEILQLTEIKGVKAYTARLLYGYGLKTPEQVAAASLDQVEEILSSGPKTAGNSSRRHAGLIINAAKGLLRAKLLDLQQQAEAAGMTLMGVEATRQLEAGGEQRQQQQPHMIQHQHNQQYQQQQQQQYQLQQILQPPSYSGTSVATLGISGQDGTFDTQQQLLAEIEEGDEEEKEQQQQQQCCLVLETPPEPPSPPDAWRFGDRSGIVVLETPDEVRAMCSLLMTTTKGGAHSDSGDLASSSFAFLVDYTEKKNDILKGGGGGGGGGEKKSVLLPPGPAAMRYQQEKHKQQKEESQPGGGGDHHHHHHHHSVDVEIHGVALCWRSRQVIYVPLKRRPGMLEALSPLLSSPSLMKLTFDLKSQMAALLKVYGLASLYPPTGGGGNNITSTITATSNNNNNSAIPLQVLEPYVDVRIATWMLMPDDPLVGDCKVHDEINHGKVPTAFETLANKKLTAGVVAATIADIKAHHHSVMSNGGGGGSTAHSMNDGNNKIGSNAVHQPPLPPPMGPSQARVEKCCCRVAIIRQMYRSIQPKLRQLPAVHAAMHTLEMPLVRVLTDLEQTGIGVDINLMKEQAHVLQLRLKQLEKAAHREVGGGGQHWELTSPEMCSWALYEVKKLAPPPSARPMKRSGGIFTTSKVVLEELQLANPNEQLPVIIQEFRKLSKILTTLETIQLGTTITSINNGGGSITTTTTTAVAIYISRCFGSFNQTCTATGRLSMDEPNLQTIPKATEFQLIMPLSSHQQQQHRHNHHQHQEEEERRVVVDLRQAFIAPQGYVLLSADYCQLELRLMAHFSKDTALLSLFRHGRDDPFRLLASQWLRKPAHTITQQERNTSKHLAYAVLYGSGVARISNALTVPAYQAETMMSSFKASLIGVVKWIDDVQRECASKSPPYVTTLAGRVRFLEHITATVGTGSSNNNNNNNNFSSREDQARGRRQAVNTIIQGSAADLAKQAMIEVHTKIRFGCTQLPAGACRMVLQIHDEFLFEVDARYVASAQAVIRECMEKVAVNLNVPLPVKIQVGASWGGLKEV